MKALNKPPIPFSGNKSNCRDVIIAIINELYKTNKNIVICDVFGGSLFVAYYIKKHFPDVRVITNDYDGFMNRLNNIETTNKILMKLNEYKEMNNIERAKGERQGKMNKTQIDDIKHIIKTFIDENPDAFIDSLSLSASLLFSNIYASTPQQLLNQKTFYDRISKGFEIEKINEYINVLNTCEIITDDYKNVIDKYKDINDIVFICDPPYLYSDKPGYKTKFWKLLDTLRIVDVFKHYKCILCSCFKSEMDELLDYFNIKYMKKEQPRPNQSTNYDVLFYNFNEV